MIGRELLFPFKQPDGVLLSKYDELNRHIRFFIKGESNIHGHKSRYIL